jgi:predicted ABC-type ATPase
MPRFRMFAGPNGSGKTSLFKELKKSELIHTGIYVNADEIEAKLRKILKFNFNPYRVSVSNKEFKHHIQHSGLFKKPSDNTVPDKLVIVGGVLYVGLEKSEINSYISTWISTYLAIKLIDSKQDFCYETVLSHPSKLKLLELARNNKYKTYLYFLFTDNKELNVQRVAQRVKQDGHAVDEALVKERYTRSMKNIGAAVNLVNTAYLIDNSKSFKQIAVVKDQIAEYIDKDYPDWLKHYYLPKIKKQ